ncbi:ArnT family glycosyltransferase [Ilumatobacter sp.]|uniref:ArnT family glycosyltransferase n=1 Tax=Ilumatobacter sp. TaxID=1967498 RepID=UPI003C688D58
MSTTTRAAQKPDRSFRRLMVASVIAGVVFLAVTIPALAVRSPLGHDESVYALRSRDLLDGWTFLSGDYWRDYRAPGLPLMLSGIGRVIGVHVTTARAFAMLLGLLIVVATALLGRRLAHWSVGAMAAALLVLSFGFVFTSTTLLADTPGAAFAMIAVVFYLRDVDAGRLRWSYLVVPLATFASTLSRFGAPFMIAAGLVGMAVVAAPNVVSARNWRLVAESAVLAVGTALVVALIVLTDTFSLNGASPSSANRVLVGRNEFTFSTGLSDLIHVINPWSGHSAQMWSKAVGVLFLVGVVLAAVSVVVQRSGWRVVIFGFVAGTISVLSIVATVGLVVPNYLSLTVPFWAILAASGWDWLFRLAIAWGRDRGLPAARIAFAGAALVFVVLAVDVGRDVRAEHHKYEVAYSNLRSASLLTRQQLGDECVLISRFTPQAGYYSQCRISPFLDWDLPQAHDSLAVTIDAVVDRWDLGIPPDSPIAVMLVEQAIRQPDLSELTDQDDLFGERLDEAGEPGQRGRYMILDVVEPCVADRSCPSFSAE